jgi:rRNA biogenesis protein RRP5
MSTAFPRGAGIEDATSSSEKKRLTISDEDNLFGAQASKRLKRIEIKEDKKLKRRKLEKSADLDEKLSKAGLGMAKAAEGGSGSHKVKIESMSYAKYSIGSLALGYILHIAENYAVVSLPGGLTGTLQYGELSDVCYNQHRQSEKKKLVSSSSTAYGGGGGGGPRGSKGHDRERDRDASRTPISDLLTPMQPVRVYVLGTTESKKSGKKSLALSMRLSLVHRGMALKHLMIGVPIAAAVASVEDNGYLMNGGIPDVNFFLPSNRVPSAFGRLELGSTLGCVVHEVNEGSRTVVLRAHPKSVREALMFGSKLAFNNLLPGHLMNIVVDKVVQVSSFIY